MTKKILFGMMAAAMVFATSCENELSHGTNAGDTAQVTFSVGTPEIATRAFSDGQTATVLQYAVYDAAGNELTDLTVTDAEIHGSANVKLQLTTGNTYSVIFWAAAEDAPYTVDFSKKTMTVDYTDAVSNDEDRDAFYKYHTFTVTGAQTETIELKRPFAQLNIGTSDYTASASAGYAPEYSYVKVPVYNTLNLVDGKVSSVNGAVTSEDAVATEFALAAIPDGETFPVSGCEYLAMNYLLVSAEKEVVDVTFGYSENNAAVEKTRTVGSVPVQRNYRTNIYGQILTNNVDINVVIEPDYDEPANEADALQLAAAIGGEVTLTEDITLTEPLNVQSNMTLNMGGKTMTGSINLADGVSLTVNGGAVVNTDENTSGIVSNGNLTLNDVEIASARHALRIESGKVVINGGTYKVDPTSAKTLHALNVGDAGTEAEVIIKGGTFIGPKGTMADSGAAVAVKSGSKVTIEGGDFSGGKLNTISNKGEMIITGGTFDQDPAAWVADGYYSNNLDGKYLVSDSAYVSDADSFAEIVKTNKEKISVVLYKDIDVAITSLGSQTPGSGEYRLGGADTKEITIDLNGKKLNITTGYWSAIGANNDNALFTIKNGSMTSTGNSAGTWNAWDLRFSNCNYAFEDVVFEKAVALDNVGKSTTMKNVTITDTHDTDTYGLWITAEGQTVTLEDCVIDMTPASDGRGIKIDNQYVDDQKKVTLNVKNVTVKTEEKAAIVVKSAAGAEINVDGIDITNVTADTEFAVWVDEDAAAHAAKVVVNGANVKVEGTIVKIEAVSSVPELKQALIDAGNAGAGNTVINLAAGEYTMPSDWTPITVDGYHGADIVTINGNGAVLKGMTTSLFNGGFAGGSGIVIKDLTIEGATIVANNTQGYGAFINCADSMNEITLINCHLVNSSVITPNDGADGSRMGALVGWTSGYSNVNDGPVKTYVNIKNCSVVGCTLKGAGSIGGICGHAGASDWTYTTIENCIVKDNNLISTDSGSWRVGVAVGTANVGQVVVNNLIESGNTLTQGTLVAPAGIRSYVGRLSLGTTGSFVVDGVAVTE